MFIHQVAFWLRTGVSKADRDQLIADCRRLLGGIPTVRQLWAGPPAMTPREVVDNSYDVGLCVVLDDEAAHHIYQEHELHTQFIDRNKAHWERVQVRDLLG